MFFARLVVKQRALLQGIADNIIGDFCWIGSTFLSKSGGDLEYVVGTARVTAGVAGNFLKNIVGRVYLHCAQATFFVGKSSPKKLHDLVFGEWLQNIDTSAREQRGVDLE